ncbi:MAG: hypothetical protein RLZZ159_1092 [Actinomycetota bacterium]|jgi:uncharacterized membrane protein
MSDMSSSSTTIDAPADEVRAVLFDIESYPTWSTAIKSVEVHEKDGSGRPTKLTIKVEAGVLKDRATLTYDWSKAPDELSFSLDEADMMTEMNGHYSIKDNGDDTTTVTYSLGTALAMPVPDMMRRKVEMSTIELSISQLKKKLES